VRLLLDESVDARLRFFLTSAGHDVTSVSVEHRAALRDAEVLEIANAEGRVLVTNDLDFGELIVREGMRHAGVVLLRLPHLGFTEVASRLRTVLDRNTQGIEDLIVITPARTRRR
jgi:predicted nuclease of predicted toxin-antitoxin system